MFFYVRKTKCRCPRDTCLRPNESVLMPRERTVYVRDRKFVFKGGDVYDPEKQRSGHRSGS